jgi:hypothetical protein
MPGKCNNGAVRSSRALNGKTTGENVVHGIRVWRSWAIGGDSEMRMLLAFGLVTLLLVPPMAAEKRLSDHEITQAFLDCPDIVKAQKEFAAGAEASTPEILLYNSMCGAAGCQYTALVAQKVERQRADPFVVHLLGYVHVGTNGKIALVERVELVPFREIENADTTDEER